MMVEKKIPRFFLTLGLIIALFALNFISLNLIGCGADEAETGEGTEQLTGEEQKKLLRFVEYVLFPSTPYIDKSWVEMVSEEEVAEKIIDFATETAAIQQTFTEFYNAYNAGSTRAVLATLWSRGIEFNLSSRTLFSKATVRAQLDIALSKGSRWGPSPTLEGFYIRPANVKAPYSEASAYGFNGPSAIGGVTYLYLVKQGTRWLINQLSTSGPPSKYFNDPKYKAP